MVTRDHLPNRTISRTRLIVLSLFAFILLLSFLEMSARLFLSFKEPSLRFILYGFIDTRKERLIIIKGQDGEMLYCKSNPSSNGINPVNSMGLRGKDIGKKKTTKIRIICLGSSTTYGTGLNYSDTYPKLLQDRLDRRFGENRFEVINAGQPGLDLPQILSLVKREIIYLYPDIVILMNTSNNLQAPGFNFVGLGAETGSKLVLKIKKFIVEHLALAFVIEKTIADRPEPRFFWHFDWQAFSKALMSPDNIWQVKFKQNLEKLMATLFENNPSLKVILLEENCNYTDYPSMEPPFEKANEILRTVSHSNRNIHTLSVQKAILDAAQRGEQVWQSPWWDYAHLIKRGNEIIADILVNDLSTTLNIGKQSQ